MKLRGGANFSRCRRYRYTLWRRWSETGPLVMMIGLNPSTADARHDDPTIRRCIRFARDWGGAGLLMVNLFAFRATYPSVLKAETDPVGPRNDLWIRRMASQSQLRVAAWGNHGVFMDRAGQIQRMLRGKLSVLRETGAGQPAHPLYLPAHLEPRPWLPDD